MPLQGSDIPTGTTVNTYAITKLVFQQLDKETPVAIVFVSRGNMVDGKFTEVDNRRHRVPDGDLAALMTTPTSDGETVYAAMKRSAYGWAVSKGHIPEGTTDV